MDPFFAAIAAVQETKRQAETMLMNLTNVVATGVGFKIAGDQVTTEPSVIVSVVKKLPTAQLTESALVPRTINGVKTDVIETGKIVAFQQQGKMRPARPGISIGHYLITAGTFGCLVQKNGQVFILSNNHVLANSNDAQVGDPIWQPGKFDGGTSADQIGTLEQFIPIGFPGGGTTPPGCSPLAAILKLFNPGGTPKSQINEPGNNTVDCAIARPTSPDLVTPDILNIGVPSGVGTATLGTALQKMGRTTAYTTGQITQIDVTVSVDYGGKVAVFKNQLMAGAMSAGGDSGSAVLDMQQRVVGLLYAGSDTTTILNPIQFVLDALQVQLVTA
ncbi:MAG: trypsin-like peptidase domain-containing protein [Chloroflexi bacterium]|nr:trypsin-like peptidase domain-containing protein [Chloroflexota bacterium]